MKVSRTISALLLTFLVLVSSTNFKVGLHVCMGKVQNVALFTNADDCEMERNLPPCHRHVRASCCEDETILHTTEDFNNAVTQVHFNAPIPVAVLQAFVFISEVIPTAPLSSTRYHNYDPPLRFFDFTVEHQVFLI